jgi:hypothetical protein
MALEFCRHTGRMGLQSVLRAMVIHITPATLRGYGHQSGSSASQGNEIASPKDHWLGSRG